MPPAFFSSCWNGKHDLPSVTGYVFAVALGDQHHGCGLHDHCGVGSLGFAHSVILGSALDGDRRPNILDVITIGPNSVFGDARSAVVVRAF